MTNLTTRPHRRFNALTGDWILVSPQRTQRPWQGKQEDAPGAQRPAYDPACYLCPGNERAGGARNPVYTETFVFTNDFAALLPATGQESTEAKGQGSARSLFRAEAVTGECRVICFSPRHDLTLAQLPVPQIRAVVNLWCEQLTELGQKYRWAQLFENKGEIMGCSNPHPHGQVWASDFLPEIPDREDRCQSAYFEQNASPLLIDYLERELVQGERIVAQNAHWVALVPWWAVWPFETLLLPRRHVLRMPDLGTEERDALALILKELTTRYDNLFQTSFPYSMGWHGAPGGEQESQHWQLHAHFCPPLLRSATVKKFMVGYELLAESQRDITPEWAAEQLRAQPLERFA